MLLVLTGAFIAPAADKPKEDLLQMYQWKLYNEGGSSAEFAPEADAYRLRKFNSAGAAAVRSEPIPLTAGGMRQINVAILLNQRSYASIYIRVRLLASPEAALAADGRIFDSSGTYVSMPFDMRYPAGEWQEMRLRFEPEPAERFVEIEVVAAGGVCDLTFAGVRLIDPEPRPLSPTWANDSVSGIEPVPHYTEPEEEIIPPMTPEIRDAVAARGGNVAGVEWREGRPRFVVNGETIAPAFYNGCWFNQRLSQYADFHRAGVKTYLLSMPVGKNLYGNGFWTGPDTYDFSGVDEWLWRILRVDPQADIILYLGCDPYVNWGTDNPGHVMADHNGNEVVVDFHTIRFGGEAPKEGERLGPSLFSAKYRQDCGNALKKLVEHLNASELGNAVIGYHLCGYSDGQFFDWDFGWKNQHVGDYSPAGMAAFRDWLSRRYGSVEALRAAWGDPEVTFATAQRPAIDEIWTENYLVDSQQVADHNRFASEGQAETVLALAQALREATDGKALIGTYYEDITGNVYNHVAVNRYLESPYIDYLAGPADYRIRKAGYSGGVRNVFGSTLLHGKLFLTEQDWRSWCAGPNSPVENFAYGRAESPEEHNAMVRRESGMMLAFGLGTWWYDLAGKWFRDDGIMAGIAEAVRAFNEDLTVGGMPEADLAVFVSEDSNYYNTLRTAEIMRGSIAKQRVQLNTSGVPYRLYLLSDLGKMPIPPHKVYLFIDCMAMTEAQRGLVNELKRDGNTLIFSGTSGIIDPDRPYVGNALAEPQLDASRAAMEELIEMKLEPFRGLPAAHVTAGRHPLTAKIDDRLALPLAYSSLLIDFPQDGVPMFAVANPDCTALATFDDGKSVAVAVKEFADYRIVYSAVPVLQDRFLHNIAATGKSWVAAEAGDAVYANDHFVTIHAMHALNGGRKRLMFRQPSRVIDLTDGTVVAERASELELTMRIGETRWFRLEPAE